MYRRLDILHRNINRVGKEITTYQYTIPQSSVPVAIKIDWWGAWMQATYGKVFGGEIKVWRSQLFQEQYITVYANRGGCTSITGDKIYFHVIGRVDLYPTHFTIQSATPIIPEPNTYTTVTTIACPGDFDDSVGRPGFYIGTSSGRVVYVMEVFEDMHFVQRLESRVVSGYVTLDSMVDGVAVLCDCGGLDFREGSILGLEQTKGNLDSLAFEDMYGSMGEIQALDIYNELYYMARFDNSQKLRYIKMRANVLSVTQKIADIITQNAWLRGTVVLNPNDTYYSIIETAARNALWNIEHV